jgi:hypothetical protein
MSKEKCPFETETCRHAGEPGGCFSDDHHIFFPRKIYHTGVEKQFRALPENHLQLCRLIHDEIHSMGAPQKPTRAEMYVAIGGKVLENEYTERVLDLVQDMSDQLKIASEDAE